MAWYICREGQCEPRPAASLGRKAVARCRSRTICRDTHPLPWFRGTIRRTARIPQQFRSRRPGPPRGTLGKFHLKRTQTSRNCPYDQGDNLRQILKLPKGFDEELRIQGYFPARLLRNHASQRTCARTPVRSIKRLQLQALPFIAASIFSSVGAGAASGSSTTLAVSNQGRNPVRLRGRAPVDSPQPRFSARSSTRARRTRPVIVRCGFDAGTARGSTGAIAVRRGRGARPPFGVVTPRNGR